MHCCPFFHWIKFCSGCYRQVFSFGGQKKWSLVALDSCLSNTVTVARELAWADSALVVLDEWSSYRGGRLRRFDCISNVLLMSSWIVTNLLRIEFTFKWPKKIFRVLRFNTFSWRESISYSTYIIGIKRWFGRRIHFYALWSCYFI